MHGRQRTRLGCHAPLPLILGLELTAEDFKEVVDRDVHTLRTPRLAKDRRRIVLRCAHAVFREVTAASEGAELDGGFAAVPGDGWLACVAADVLYYGDGVGCA